MCQNEKEGDIAAKKKELELADEEDFGNDCFGKGHQPTGNTVTVATKIFYLRTGNANTLLNCIAFYILTKEK